MFTSSLIRMSVLMGVWGASQAALADEKSFVVTSIDRPGITLDDSSLPPAQSCLIGTQKCLDLMKEPFKLCRLSADDCPKDAQRILIDKPSWRVIQLAK